jgi:hypothetical protein
LRHAGLTLHGGTYSSGDHVDQFLGHLVTEQLGSGIGRLAKYIIRAERLAAD